MVTPEIGRLVNSSPLAELALLSQVGCGLIRGRIKLRVISKPRVDCNISQRRSKVATDRQCPLTPKPTSVVDTRYSARRNILTYSRAVNKPRYPLR